MVTTKYLGKLHSYQKSAYAYEDIGSIATSILPSLHYNGIFNKILMKKALNKPTIWSATLRRFKPFVYFNVAVEYALPKRL
ncbi:MAG: hypothetical protein ACJAUT_000078 [Cellvibrionaceae bacterium]